VYYSDTDAGGVVYHSRYLDMAEHARTELVRHFGGEQQALLDENAQAFVVRTLSISYNKPARLDDALTVRTSVRKCEAITMVFDQKICRGEEILAELEVKVGSISVKTGRPVPIPGDWRETIRKELIPPES
jgi:acyl-CoA thioester hydrolase